MKIVKILKDYSKTPLEQELSELFTNKLDSTLCYEKIKNKEFIIQHLKPLNDFIIYTTALPCANLDNTLSN